MEYTNKEKNAIMQRLKDIISTKFKTTMVYPLSQFEILFGSLIGIGVEENKLTSEQKEYREKWKICRDSILTLGNNQRRNAMAELDRYDVTLKRYKTIFIPIEKMNEFGNEENFNVKE